MDYSEVFEQISRQTKIAALAFSQVQDYYKEIWNVANNCFRAALPALSIIAQEQKRLRVGIQLIAQQISPVVSNLRKILNDLEIPSLLSQLQDIQTLSQRLSEVKSISEDTDAFSGTVFEEVVDTVDEAVCERVLVDSLIVSEKIVNNDKQKPIQRKLSLKKFFKILANIFTSTVFPLILFMCAPFWQSYVDEHIQPQIYYHEFKELQEQNPDLNLRLVTKNTALYLGKRMKMITAIVEKYDIVEVIEDCGKILKVKMFDSDEVGWIYKKYTKAAK